MGIVLTIVVITVFCYLAYCFYKQTEANDEHITLINTAEKNWVDAIEETTQAKKELIQSIAELFGQNDAERVDQNKIWIGMNKQLLLASWGNAEEIKESYVRGKQVEKMYYRPYINRLGSKKYEFEITVEDFVITGWKDLI